MDTTRGQAICMFFAVEHNKQNVEKYSRKIEDFGEVDTCYEIDFKNSILVPLHRIYADPFTNKSCLYKNSDLLFGSSNEKKIRIKQVFYSLNRLIQYLQNIATQVQAIQFLNEAITPFDPQNKAVYELTNISLRQVIL